MSAPTGAGRAPASVRSNAKVSASSPVASTVIARTGSPLDPALRSDMERRFGEDFSRVRIHTGAGAAHSAGEVDARAFTIGNHIVFGRDESPSDRHLLAHELAHVVQQETQSPYIARKPLAKPRASGSKTTGFEGALLGTSRADRQILVGRQVGEKRGYDDRLQAIAIARLAGAEPAAVALDKGGKWHAFETKDGDILEGLSANDPGVSATKDSTPFQTVDFLPSASGIVSQRLQVDALRSKLAELEKLRSTGPIEVQKSATIKLLSQAEQRLAALIFGTGELEIQFNRYVSGRAKGKINLTRDTQGGNTAGRHGPVSGQKDTDFSIDLITAFDINAEHLSNPALAQGILFHEVSHLKDIELAQTWARRYQDETGRLFVRSKLEFFQTWLNEQVRKKRLTGAEAQLILDEAVDASASTEARSNLRTFLSYFRTGHFELASEAIVGYAKALPPGTVYANLIHPSPVSTELIDEMKTAYRNAGKSKAQFAKAIAAAVAANPKAWFAKVKFF
jgi:hypothetical protein